VLGFRAWTLRVDGGLGALIAGSVWQPGVNEAICSPDVIPSRRPRHTSPQRGCNCGFNAYFALRPELRGSEDTVVGAIAAWGEIDVYADGFRARFAQVIALALPADRSAAVGLERRRRAAQRYGVPLVPIKELRDEALQHAAPVAKTMLPGRAGTTARRRRPPAPAPSPPPPVAVASWKRASGHSIWVRHHVVVSAGDGELEIAPAPAASALADPLGAVRVAGVGSRVEPDACIATIAAAYPGALIHLRTPVGGRVLGHNPDFIARLRDGDRAAAAAPWLIRLEPDDAPLEDAPLLWGRPGVELYRRSVADRSDAAILAELDPPPGFDAAALESLAAAAPGAPLAPHQRLTTTLTPAQGRRAAIMCEQLRPLLAACGESAALLAA